MNSSLFLLEPGGRDEIIGNGTGTPVGLGSLARAGEIKCSPLGLLGRGFLGLGAGRKGRPGQGIGGRNRDTLLILVW